MNLTQGPAAARPNLTGIGIVALLHVLLGYALLSGLARQVVDVIKAPLETHLLEEVIPPPPPPPPQVAPPPKLAPPPAFVPPAEVTPPPPPQPTITTTHSEPPAVPVAITPAAPVVEAPAAPPRAAVPARIDVASCDKPDYPAAALRAGATGVTRVRFAIDAAGRVVQAELESASGASREHRLLDRSAVEALSQCRFKPGIDEAGRAVGSTAVVSYVWKTD